MLAVLVSEVCFVENDIIFCALVSGWNAFVVVWFISYFIYIFARLLLHF